MILKDGYTPEQADIVERAAGGKWKDPLESAAEKGRGIIVDAAWLIGSLLAVLVITEGMPW